MAKWQGKKFGGTHTTLIEAAEPLVVAAENLPEVKKIVLGIIISKPNKMGKERIKFTQMSGGLKATVRGAKGIQEIWIYSDFPEQVLKNLHMY